MRFLFLPIFLVHITGLLSCAYLESGVYVIEQQRTTYPTGATIRLEIYLLIFWLGVLSLRLRLSYLSVPPTSSGVIKLALFGASVLLLILFINLTISDPPPLLREGYATRFGYLETTKLWTLISAIGVSGTIVPLVLGFARWAAGRSRERLLSTTLLVFYILYLILLGHKFGGIVFALFFFFLPSVTAKLLQDRSYRLLTKKTLFISSLIFIGVFSFVFYHYSRYPVIEKFGGALGFIVYRIFALQGHLWWGIDEYVFIQNGDAAPLPLLLDSMPQMMRQVAPPIIAESAISRGVQFAFGFPGSAIYYFGMLGGGMVTFLSGVTFGLLSRLVVGGVRSKNTLAFIPAGYMWARFYVYLSQGTYDRFFSVQFAVLVAAWLFLTVACTAAKAPSMEKV